MNSSNIIAGIDVSKNKLDIHIHPLGHYKVLGTFKKVCQAAFLVQLRERSKKCVKPHF